MPRLRARVDANQPTIVKALGTIGATVLYLHQLGGGIPDLLVGYRGRNVLLELKACKAAPNDQQRSWHAWWRGQVAVVHTSEEAVAVLMEET